MSQKVLEFTLEEVKKHAENRPPGYLSDLLDAGRVVGDSLHITQESISKLRGKYQMSWVMIVKHGLSSAVKWFGAGLPIVTKEQLEVRADKCSECEEWVGGKFREGKGKCNQCGCGSLKPYLKTEECRHLPSKWPKL